MRRLELVLSRVVWLCQCRLRSWTSSFFVQLSVCNCCIPLRDHELLFAIQVWSAWLDTVIVVLWQVLDLHLLTIYTRNRYLHTVLSLNHWSSLLLMHVEVSIWVLDITHVRALLHTVCPVCVLSSVTILALQAPHGEALWTCSAFLAVSAEHYSNRLLANIVYMRWQQWSTSLVRALILHVHLVELVYFKHVHESVLVWITPVGACVLVILHLLLGNHSSTEWLVLEAILLLKVHLRCAEEVCESTLVKLRITWIWVWSRIVIWIVWKSRLEIPLLHLSR